MYCPRCGSSNVNVQIVQQTQLVPRRRGIAWWLFIGWWWVPLKWICFTVPALVVKLLAPKRQKLVQRTRSVCVCQNCGNHWNA